MRQLQDSWSCWLMREEAEARRLLFADTSEACLYRRMAELKEQDYRASVEDIMYMLLVYKFSDLQVHLIPSLLKCMYNGRLEIFPSKDWALESIHNFEVLQMITIVGWKPNSSLTENWAITKINHLHLHKVYSASIVPGYFLKSVAFRYQLEMSYANDNNALVFNSGTHLPFSEMCNYGVKSIASGQVSSSLSTSLGQVPYINQKTQANLRSYAMGFDCETLKMCSRPRSNEAQNFDRKAYLCFLWTT